MKRAVILISVYLLGFSNGVAICEEQAGPATIAEKTADFVRYPGFFAYYWDSKAGKIWLEIDRWNKEFLYINSLPAGVGSNDIGLDRGQLGNTRVVEFERIGPKVLLVEPNYGFRAISQNTAERKSVQEAFAQSVLWGFEVAATSDSTVLVDATDFYLRDAHGVSTTLSNTNQGTYQPDASRSAFYLPRSKNFPRNTEIEVTLTFTGKAAGRYVRQVVPTPDAITVRQHHSFVQLPESNYKPRKFDPRAGFWGITFQDYATPISEPLVKRFIARHRLNKKDPDAAVSEAVEPIVYYVDPGAPEPVRSALIAGAQWWNQAFEAIGYRDAFQVKLLPEDADPMDVRYNVIQWVHRATRGWSYGGGVVDPRTGEIIKGHVTLGSLRVRQDFLIAQGLMAPYAEGESRAEPMREMALARLRQLSAHEVGHTLGLTHNFAASISERASVMDYPHPYVQLGEDDKLDFSRAYAVGIGAWDKAAIAYGYSDFAPGADEAALQGIIDSSIANGLLFITDQDARPAGGAHPLAHLWDNGSNATDELYRILRIREYALNRFSENNIAMQATFSSLEEVLVPLYLSHRYQVDAASKLIGGLFYTYATRGDGQKVTEIVDPAQQRKALDAVLQTLSPKVLTLPEQVIRLIPPRAYGYSRSRETFDVRTAVTFDPLAAAETAADMTAAFLFHPARAARLVEYHARNSRNPGLSEVIDKIIAATWKSGRKEGLDAEVGRVSDAVVLRHLMLLASNAAAATQVRAVASAKLAALQEWLEKNKGKVREDEQAAHLAYAAQQIARFQSSPDEFKPEETVTAPDGSPIGMGMLCEFE